MKKKSVIEKGKSSWGKYNHERIVIFVHPYANLQYDFQSKPSQVFHGFWTGWTDIKQSYMQRIGI